MQRDELAGWLRLALTWEVDARSARRLLAAFGLPSSIFEQDAGALAQLVDRAAADALRKDPPGFAARLDETLAWLAQGPGQREILSLGDAGYPPALLAIEDPPLLLY